MLDITLRETAIKEVSYREIPRVNASSVKIMAKRGPKAFYKSVFERTKTEEEEELSDSKAITIGDLFDFLSTDCNGELDVFNNRLDEQYTRIKGVKSSRQEFLLADKMIQLIRQKYITSDGKMAVDFHVVFNEATDSLKADGKFSGKTPEKIYELFCEVPKTAPDLGTPMAYYLQRLDDINKKVVDEYMVSTVEVFQVQSLTDPWVEHIFHPTGVVVNKFVAEWDHSTTYGTLGCKAEMDKVIWYYDQKRVLIVDIKTIYDTRTEEIKYRYNKLRYGWQAEFYRLAMRDYLDKNGMEDFTIEFQFVFFCTGNRNRPVVLEMTETMMNEALFGYHDGYRFHPGMNETLDDIAFAIGMELWDVERSTYFNNGKVIW